MKKSKLILVLTLAAACGAAGAQTVDNWKSAYGDNVKNAAGECWRNASWTPATAAPGCDGALLVIQAPVTPFAAHVVEALPVGVTQVVQDQHINMTLNADTLFDFDKSVIRASAKRDLKIVSEKIASLNATNVTVTVVGHTDSRGSAAYNDKLSLRRAETVKAYLVSKGIASNSITTIGKGEHQPIADNATAKGRSENRRVNIEVRVPN